MNKTLILTLIVLSQFFGTSLWFSSNAVLEAIAKAHQLKQDNLLSSLTIATQLGFIVGSLLYAFFNIADRFKANIVFSISIILAAISNVAILQPLLRFEQLFFFRFLTGFFLAGVYPVGMKIAAYFFPKSVSNALGVLVGALVVGTAFPHLINGLQLQLPWSTVLLVSSTLAVSGGAIMLFLPTPVNPNYQKIYFSILPKLFQSKSFKNACIGYFGHMWELYTFWAFIPVLITAYIKTKSVTWSVSLLSFMVIGVGALGCVIAGKLAQKTSTLLIAKYALAISLTCCLVSPFSFALPPTLFLCYLLLWGIAVVADSPLLSSMVNKHAIASYNGTALTLSTSIGFLVTILSIAFFDYLLVAIRIPQIFTILAIGPLVSLQALRKKQ